MVDLRYPENKGTKILMGKRTWLRNDSGASK